MSDVQLAVPFPAEPSPSCCRRVFAASPQDLPVTCPTCGLWWSPVLARVGRVPDEGAPANDTEVHVVVDLGTLAAWRSLLDGRAWCPEGRPRGGLRRAIDALHRLDALHRAGPHEAAEVLWWAYVHVDERARQAVVDPARPVAERFAPPQRLAHWQRHKASRMGLQQIEAYGRRLLADAHAAYEDLVRGVIAPPSTAPEHPTACVRRLGALFERVAGRAPTSR